MISPPPPPPARSLSLPLPLQFMAAWIAMWLGRHQDRMIEYLKEENRTLRAALGKRRVPLSDAERRRLAVLGKRLGFRGLGQAATIATPDTILRWYRELVARKYDGSSKRGPGRPHRPEEIASLVVRMATENVTWGYTRIRGALKNLGYEIGRSTIRRILIDHGIDPVVLRRKQTSWATFLKAHLGAIVGMDFFTVEIVSWTGLIRLHVLFVIDIATRAVEVVGIGRDPDGAWMRRMALKMLDESSGVLRGKQLIIMDRDPVFTAEFRRLLGEAGVEPVDIPANSPNLNAYAERFVRSIKGECLSRMVPLGETHLRNSIDEYMRHYHGERNHQGLGNRLIHGLPRPANTNAPISRRERLGGLLNYYHREAA